MMYPIVSMGLLVAPLVHFQCNGDKAQSMCVVQDADSRKEVTLTQLNDKNEYTVDSDACAALGDEWEPKPEAQAVQPSSCKKQGEGSSLRLGGTDAAEAAACALCQKKSSKTKVAVSPGKINQASAENVELGQASEEEVELGQASEEEVELGQASEEEVADSEENAAPVEATVQQGQDCFINNGNEVVKLEWSAEDDLYQIEKSWCNLPDRPSHIRKHVQLMGPKTFGSAEYDEKCGASRETAKQWDESVYCQKYCWVSNCHWCPYKAADSFVPDNSKLTNKICNDLGFEKVHATLDTVTCPNNGRVDVREGKDEHGQCQGKKKRKPVTITWSKPNITTSTWSQTFTIPMR